MTNDIPRGALNADCQANTQLAVSRHFCPRQVLPLLFLAFWVEMHPQNRHATIESRYKTTRKWACLPHFCLQICLHSPYYVYLCRVIYTLLHRFCHLFALWFAFKLVSLQSHIHHVLTIAHIHDVVICFQISIFAESYTPLRNAPVSKSCCDLLSN